MRHWEDFQVGEVAELGPVAVTEHEIVEFARRMRFRSRGFIARRF
jgi:hypothetical protein